MMELSRAVGDKDHDDGATAITAIDDNGVPYDIDFLYGGDGGDGDDHYNEKEEDTMRPVRTTAPTSTWPSKMMMIMVQRMGGSSSMLQSMRSSFQSSVSSSDETESSTRGNPTRDGLMRRCDNGVVSLDGDDRSHNSGIDSSPSSFHKAAAQKQPDLVVAYLLKIQAAIEMEEQPSSSQSPPPRYHRFHQVILLDEIILGGTHWRKWINLSTLTALLVILVTGGVVGTSWYHVHRQSNYYDERQRDYAMVKARLGSMMFDVANCVDMEKGPYHRALQWLATEDYLYQEAIIEFRDNDLLQRFSMAAIYFATSEEEEDAPWNRCGPVSYRCESPAARWLGPYHECQWVGVECDSLDRVVAIKLSKSSCCSCCSCSRRDFICCPRYCLLLCSLCLLLLLLLFLL
jgi:hypothetical protein